MLLEAAESTRWVEPCVSPTEWPPPSLPPSLPPHAGRLLVTINEPSGPFTASGAVILQTESPRNITVVTAHTYEISCSSNIGVTPVWRHNGSSVMSSPPISGTPGVYVRGPANQERVLVLQNITQSVVGTFVCLEGNSQDADSATFIVTTGKGVQLAKMLTALLLLLQQVKVYSYHMIGRVSNGVRLLWLGSCDH